MWKIPLADIDIGEDENDAVNQVLRSRWLSMGGMITNFEAAFAEALNVKHAVAVASGTAALHIAHTVLGIHEGDEVICPALTFVATANAILYTGAVPVFADISSQDDLNISPERVREKISPRTRAITVVHYGGYPCNMDEILRIAKEHGLYVIEDAAHAIGATYNGSKAGTIGDIGCFSFYSNKNMTTGEGGMIVTDDDDIAERMRRIRSHGMTSLTWDRHRGHAFSYDVIDLGFNYRMDEIRAAIGLVQLKKLGRYNRKRKEMADIYREKLDGIEGIEIPFQNFKGDSAHHIYPVLLDSELNRKIFIDGMGKRGIQTSIHYPPVHLFTFYKRKYGFREGMLPVTEEICEREVTLPLYPAIGRKNIHIIVEAAERVIGGETKRLS